VEADIPALAEINTHSYLPEAIMPFFFSSWPNPAPFVSYFTARAQHNFKDPNTEVYKIVDEQSNEILGFVCMAISDGNRAHVSSSNPGGDFDVPAGMNMEFGMATDFRDRQLRVSSNTFNFYSQPVLRILCS
jgi:hypothetical protein